VVTYVGAEGVKFRVTGQPWRDWACSRNALELADEVLKPRTALNSGSKAEGEDLIS